jgi:tRNA threonylcarbamoyladenosine biosynthesis protein TsaE
MVDGGRQIVITHSAEGTGALGEVIGAALVSGDLILLQGSFGAGKTVLVQGVARGLGIQSPVTSPSFVLMVEHVGERRLVHVDFFRIERADADLIASVEDYLDSGWIVAIEWPDWLPASLAGSATIVRLETLTENERRISVVSPSDEVRSAVARSSGPASVGTGE